MLVLIDLSQVLVKRIPKQFADKISGKNQQQWNLPLCYITKALSQRILQLIIANQKNVVTKS